MRDTILNMHLKFWKVIRKKGTVSHEAHALYVRKRLDPATIEDAMKALQSELRDTSVILFLIIDWRSKGRDARHGSPGITKVAGKNPVVLEVTLIWWDLETSSIFFSHMDGHKISHEVSHEDEDGHEVDHRVGQMTWNRKF